MAKKKIRRKSSSSPTSSSASGHASRAVGQVRAPHTPGAGDRHHALATVIVGSVVLGRSPRGARRALGGAGSRADASRPPSSRPPGAPPKDDGAPALRRPRRSALEAALKELDGHFSGPGVPLVRRGDAGARQPAARSRSRATRPGALREAARRTAWTSACRFLAREGLGYAYERKGKLPEAQAAFAKLGDDAGGWATSTRTGPATTRPGWPSCKATRRDATRIYHEVLDKNPTTSLREEITNRLAAARAEVTASATRSAARRRGRSASCARWPVRRGCAGDRPPARRRSATPPHPAGVLQIVWRTTLHDHGLFEPAPEECAPACWRGGRLVIGSRAGNRRRRRARHRARRLGDRRLGRRRQRRRASTPRAGRSTSAPTTAASTPSIPGPGEHPLDLPRQGRDRASGRGRPGPGLRRQRRRSHGGARARDRKVALAVRARHARRVHHPRLRRPAAARRRSSWRGFADGYFVALSGGDRRGALGALAGRRVRAVRRRRHDAGDRAATSPTSRRTRAASARSISRDGAIKWRLGIEGVGDVSVADDRLYFVAPRQGCTPPTSTATSSGARA